MFKRLSTKLTVTLFGLLLLMSASFIGFALWTAPMFLQELNQKLNLNLAENIVKEKNSCSTPRLTTRPCNRYSWG